VLRNKILTALHSSHSSFPNPPPFLRSFTAGFPYTAGRAFHRVNGRQGALVLQLLRATRSPEFQVVLCGHPPSHDCVSWCPEKHVFSNRDQIDALCVDPPIFQELGVFLVFRGGRVRIIEEDSPGKKRKYHRGGTSGGERHLRG